MNEFPHTSEFANMLGRVAARIGRVLVHDGIDSAKHLLSSEALSGSFDGPSQDSLQGRGTSGTLEPNGF